jgi:hypothetical protein
MLTAVMLVVVLRVVFLVAFTIMMSGLMMLRPMALTLALTAPVALTCMPLTGLPVLIILIAVVIGAAVFGASVVTLARPVAMRLRFLGAVLTLFFAVSFHHILRPTKLFIGKTLDSFNDLVGRAIRARRFHKILFAGRILLTL